jgi:hypothetical protein
MDMNIRVELCHVDTLRCVVRVEAWKDAHLIGSSLGEAPTAEDAEDRAFNGSQNASRESTPVRWWMNPLSGQAQHHPMRSPLS